MEEFERLLWTCVKGAFLCGDGTEDFEAKCKAATGALLAYVAAKDKRIAELEAELRNADTSSRRDAEARNGY